MNPLAQVSTATEGGATELLANLSIPMIGIIALVLSIVRFGLLNPMSPKRPNGMARGIAEVCESLLVALVLVFLLIRPFFIQAFFIPSASMENTLLGHTASEGYKETVNDHIFVNKMLFRISDPQFRDIIVFRAPKEADRDSFMRGLPQVENVLIKRVIGVPGDTIEVKDVEETKDGQKELHKAVFRNGQKLEEPYIKEPMDVSGNSDAHFAIEQPLKLGSDEYFVMGDNRNNSNDSRYWGTVKRNRIMGKASFIFMPFNRMGKIK